VPVPVIEKKCLLIPKDSKIYGIADHANSSYPFNIKRKGKLLITLNHVKLESGDIIPLSLVETPEQGKERYHAKSVIRDCRRYEKQNCIVGRRNNYQFPAGAIGDITSAGILLGLDTDNKYTPFLGFLSVFGAISKATGIEGFINPPNAVLKAGLIFEVQTLNLAEPAGKHPGGWITYPRKETPKEEEKK
jgi:hypothetical protein